MQDPPELITRFLALDVTVNSKLIYNLLKNKSTLNNLQHMVAYLQRFVHNCRNRKNKLTVFKFFYGRI